MTETLNAETPTVRCEVEELPRWRRRLSLRVEPQSAERARERHVRRLAKRVKVKGFRPGKAPHDLIRQQYKDEIEREALKELLQEGVSAGIRQAGLDPVTTPEVSDVHWAPDGGLELVAEVDVKPEIELPRTGGFRIEKKIRRIDDADVDRVLERLRDERAEWRPVERPAADGDRIVFDSVPLGDDGEPRDAERIENHEVELGKGELLPDFEAGLTGRAAGDQTRVTVRFAEDHPNAALRGRSREFDVSVSEVREKLPPAMDDAFAREVGDFESLGTLRERIRRNLEEEIAQQSTREVNEALIDEIISANPIDLPESMVERYLRNMMSDRHGPLGGQVPPEREEQLRGVLRPGAERALRRYYILQRIAEREGLEAGDEALEAALRERLDEDQTLDQARGALERSGQLDDLRFHLTMERVFDWLRERSRVIPVEVEGEE